ncbi:COG1361 S-layer family protein [Natrialbaceae archaeon GCM10025810]|uniref:COG1361 S-layer family protein n=1 Tax=Halovalidus salilacus TaxID=3075124 RepID=UPI0036227818
MPRLGPRVTVAVVLLAALGATVALVGATGVLAQEDSDGTESSGLTRGEPELDVWAEQDEVTPGSDSPLEVTVQNDGDLETGSQSQSVLTARGVTVEIEDAGPFEAASGKTSLGPIEDGSSATAPLELEVPDDTEPGTYDVEVEVEYAYTNIVWSDGGQQRLTERETHDISVEIPDEPRFEMGSVETDIEPGANGEASIDVENTGTKPANETRVALTGSGGVAIDGGASETSLGDLEPGESTTTTVEAAIDGSTGAADKSIEGAFTYEDENGIERNAPSERAPFSPGDAQSFSITRLDDTLAVGYDGTVSGEVRNDGPQTVDDAVLVAEPMSDSLAVEDTRYALPELKPGASADFSYPTDVTGSADPGDRQFRFTVEYTGSGDTTLTDGPLSERVTVDDDADEFSISDDDASVRQGESGEVVLEITNERPETLSNIDAMLYDDSPLEATDDEAFVDELEPGESAELRFELSAEDDAPVETHPVELDFEYDTERGDTVLSDTYQHPIDVEASEGDGGGFPSWAVVGLAVLTVTGVGATVWLRHH